MAHTVPVSYLLVVDLARSGHEVNDDRGEVVDALNQAGVAAEESLTIIIILQNNLGLKYTFVQFTMHKSNS